MRGQLALVLWAIVTAACGPSSRDNGPDCTSVCTSFGFQQCHADGTFDPPQACGPDETCDPLHGCVVCVPDGLYCGGPTANDVLRCNSEGTGGTVVESCPADSVCSGGQCKTPCQAAEDKPSNVGCDFWAADLDNEATSGLISNDAAAQQFALVAANNNDYPIMVSVTKNAANIGQPVNEQVILQVSVPPRTARRMDLPQREVDGSMGQNGTYTQNSGSGTFVSPHAYHVVSTGPMVLYQFNPIIQQFSNDASTLIPRHAVGMDYIVSGYETANPCAISGLPMTDPSIPDHGAVTIIPIEDDTHVTVTASHAIKASAGPSGIAIPMTAKGGTLNLTLSRYAVANLESQMTVGSIGACSSAVMGGADGDFTGTYIKSDKPIVVFTSNERGAGFGNAPNVEYPPGWDPMNGDDTCCTDHLEEQLLPVTALGKEFAVARSPIRSTHATWKEPDIVRVLGTADGTTVTTNLPAPWNSFTLNARQDKTFAATTGFTLSASAPVQITTYLVSQHFVKYGYTGDPAQITIPAAEQHRKDYVFLVPPTFQYDYAVFAKPVDAHITVDGVALDGVEFSNCVKAPIGMLVGTMYEQVTCPMADGAHVVSGDKPFGLSVYGYYNVGSYAFVGGSDVKIINPIL
ncbi:MAG: IgGFc-binding protein [Myxococcales bacterium]|nr:IgGFc-binding protein [Myxococcales bacterium]